MADLMKPVDVGAPVLIPQGNLDTSQPGSFGSMAAALGLANSSSNIFTTRTQNIPSFKPGYTTKGLDNVEWQCMTNVTHV